MCLRVSLQILKMIYFIEHLRNLLLLFLSNNEEHQHESDSFQINIF